MTFLNYADAVKDPAQFEKEVLPVEVDPQELEVAKTRAIGILSAAEIASVTRDRRRGSVTAPTLDLPADGRPLGPQLPAPKQARLQWFTRFRRLKPGHSLKALARRWGETYDAVQHWSHLFGYDKAPYRQGLPDEVWAQVDWDHPLKDVARQLGVTTSAASRRRKALGVPPLRAGGQRNKSPAFVVFKKWVHKYGHLLHRLPASQVLRLVGVQKHVHPFAAAHPLRAASVLPHDPGWLRPAARPSPRRRTSAGRGPSTRPG